MYPHPHNVNTHKHTAHINYGMPRNCSARRPRVCSPSSPTFYPPLRPKAWKPTISYRSDNTFSSESVYRSGRRGKEQSHEYRRGQRFRHRREDKSDRHRDRHNNRYRQVDTLLLIIYCCCFLVIFLICYLVYFLLLIFPPPAKRQRTDTSCFSLSLRSESVSLVSSSTSLSTGMCNSLPNVLWLLCLEYVDTVDLLVCRTNR